MKKTFIIACLASACMLAHGAQNNTYFAIGAAAANVEIISPSVAVYAPKFEAGLEASGLNYNGSSGWSTTLWGGLRRPIKNNLNLTMGTSVTGVFNSSTNDLYAVSPYIGFDIIHLSGLPVLLGGWINPVSWNKAQGDSHAAWVFGSGGLKLAYLF